MAPDVRKRFGAPNRIRTEPVQPLVRLTAAPSQGAAGGLLVGAGASFASSLVAARLLRPHEGEWPLWPFAAYRGALGLSIALRG